MERLLNWLNQSNVNLITLFATVALLAAAAILIGLLNRLLTRSAQRIERRLALPHETLITISRVVSGTFWVITGMLLLNLWGVSLSHA